MSSHHDLDYIKTKGWFIAVIPGLDVTHLLPRKAVVAATEAQRSRAVTNKRWVLTEQVLPLNILGTDSNIKGVFFSPIQISVVCRLSRGSVGMVNRWFALWRVYLYCAYVGKNSAVCQKLAHWGFLLTFCVHKVCLHSISIFFFFIISVNIPRTCPVFYCQYYNSLG